MTGSYLRSPTPGKTVFRKRTGTIRIEDADKYNLKKVSVSVPTGCITSVTGPSGSGKSTLIFGVLARGLPDFEHNRVIGLEQFDRIIKIEQSSITRMKRSNTATYTEVYTDIRSVFCRNTGRKKAGFTAKYFSFNSPGGRCENCEGLGRVNNNMLFLQTQMLYVQSAAVISFNPLFWL